MRIPVSPTMRATAVVGTSDRFVTIERMDLLDITFPMAMNQFVNSNEKLFTKEEFIFLKELLTPNIVVEFGGSSFNIENCKIAFYIIDSKKEVK